MRFHLNGFRPGNPDIHPEFDFRSNELSAETDVLFAGTSPANSEDSAVPERSSDERQRFYSDSGRVTSGFATDYPPTMITGSGNHDDLAPGFLVGERLHSAPAVLDQRCFEH